MNELSDVSVLSIHMIKRQTSSTLLIAGIKSTSTTSLSNPKKDLRALVANDRKATSPCPPPNRCPLGTSVSLDQLTRLTPAFKTPLRTHQKLALPYCLEKRRRRCTTSLPSRVIGLWRGLLMRRMITRSRVGMEMGCERGLDRVALHGAGFVFYSDVR